MRKSEQKQTVTTIFNFFAYEKSILDLKAFERGCFLEPWSTDNFDKIMGTLSVPRKCALFSSTVNAWESYGSWV